MPDFFFSWLLERCLISFLPQAKLTSSATQVGGCWLWKLRCEAQMCSCTECWSLEAEACRRGQHLPGGLWAVCWCSGGMLLAAAGGFTVGNMLRQKVLQLSFASVTKMARSWGKQKLTFTYNLVVDQGAIRRWAFTQLAIKSQCQWDSVCIASVVV